MNSIVDSNAQRVRGTTDLFKIVEIWYGGLIEFLGKQHEQGSFFGRLLPYIFVVFIYYKIVTAITLCSRTPGILLASLYLLILFLSLSTLQNFRPLVHDHSDVVNNTSVEQLPESFSRWTNGHQDLNQIQQFFQILSYLSRRNIFDQTQHGTAVILSNVTLPSSHDDLSNRHDTVCQNYARNNSSNIGLDDTESVQSTIRANTNVGVNAQERNSHIYMKYLPIGTDRNYSMTYCKFLYTEDNSQKADEPMTKKIVETDLKKNDKADFMTQTNESVNNERTSDKKLSIQTYSYVDFRYIPRDEPDGQSRNDSTTYVKIIIGTDDQSDCDNTTHVKEVNTTFSDCRQSYTEDWIDSLDVLIGSYLNGSHTDIGNLSLESSSFVPEIYNADQCSSGDEDNNNGTEATSPFVMADLSFDSDDMFGD